MTHKAGLMLGQITEAEFKELSRLKATDPDAYFRREVALETTRSQLVAKYGLQAVDRAEKEFRRVDQLTMEHLEETQHKGVDSLDLDLAQVANRSLFGTRRDGRVYRKEVPTLDFRGRVGRISIYEGIIDQFKKTAVSNRLPESYGYRLLSEVSNTSLQLRYHLTHEQVLELKNVAAELARKAEGRE